MKNLNNKSFNSGHFHEVQNNKTGIEARSYNHFCRRKAISIKYSDFVSVALGGQHAMCTRYVAICGLPPCTIFFHIISQRQYFRKKI
jgi:hypothetical protein